MRSKGLLVGILHAEPREQELSLAKRLGELGAHVHLLDVRTVEPAEYTGFDCVLNRVYPSTSFTQGKAVLDRTVRVVLEFEQAGVFVLSGALCTVADYSKLLAAKLLLQQGVRTPATAALTQELASSPAPFLPLVLKPDVGAFGRDCLKIDCEQQWRQAIDNSDWRERTRIVQPYVRPVNDVDYRITVLFGEIVFVYQRKLEAGWFGNSSEPSELSPAHDTIPREALAVAVRSSLATGALANGVDLIVGEDGPTVIENNPTFGFSPGSWKIDVVAERIFAFLCSRALALESGRMIHERTLPPAAD